MTADRLVWLSVTDDLLTALRVLNGREPSNLNRGEVEPFDRPVANDRQRSPR